MGYCLCHVSYDACVNICWLASLIVVFWLCIGFLFAWIGLQFVDTDKLAVCDMCKYTEIGPINLMWIWKVLLRCLKILSNLHFFFSSPFFFFSLSFCSTHTHMNNKKNNLYSLEAICISAASLLYFANWFNVTSPIGMIRYEIL